MGNFEIKSITLSDVNKLQDISIRTFLETFSENNSEKEIANYITNSFSLEKLTTELQNKDSEFYFVLFETKIIGYLKLNYGESQTEIKDPEALEIERIYVLKEFHGKNIGLLLLKKTIQIATNINAKYIWLGVWEENAKAMHFYKKNGFIAFHSHIFKLGNEEQTDIMMKLKL